MWHQSRPCHSFFKMFKVSKPPVSGYEIAELPNEVVLRDYMQFYRTKGVLVILHSGDLDTPPPASQSTVTATQANAALPVARQMTGVARDAVTRSFISSLNAVNLGNPDEVKLALVPGPRAPRMVNEYNILTYPTTLLFLDNRCVYRCVGARTHELSIKSLFMLRNAGRNVFSRL